MCDGLVGKEIFGVLSFPNQSPRTALPRYSFHVVPFTRKGQYAPWLSMLVLQEWKIRKHYSIIRFRVCKIHFMECNFAKRSFCRTAQLPILLQYYLWLKPLKKCSKARTFRVVTSSELFFATVFWKQFRYEILWDTQKSVFLDSGWFVIWVQVLQSYHSWSVLNVCKFTFVSSLPQWNPFLGYEELARNFERNHGYFFDSSLKFCSCLLT